MNSHPLSAAATALRRPASHLPTLSYPHLWQRGCSSWALGLLLLLTLPGLVRAQFNYTVSNSTVTITRYTGSGGAVVIPDTINGLPVTAIGNNAFYDCLSVTNVTFPDSVISIGGAAFWNCTGLRSVSFGTNLVSIGGDAFYYCVRLANVTLPDSVRSLGLWAFYECLNLTNVTIGSGLIDLGARAFYDCLSLTAITVDARNLRFSSLDGVLFSKPLTTLIQYPAAKPGTDYTIPSGVGAIGNEAFQYSIYLTTVTLPGSVTSIGQAAFSYGYSLRNVTVPNGVTTIADDTFANCTVLTNLTLPSGLTSIGEYAFAGCSSLRSLTIPNGVTSIGAYAFNTCYQLASLAFPAGVTNIGTKALCFCGNLSEITVDAANPVYSSVDGVLFDKSRTTLLQCPGGKSGCYTIPEGVTNLGSTAFNYCTNLTGVVIPTSITSIPYQAFYECISLASVTIPDSVNTIANLSFAQCSSLTSLVIPASVTNIMAYAFSYCTNLSAVWFKGDQPRPDTTLFYHDPTTVYYLPGTANWGSKFGGAPTVLWNPRAKTDDDSFGVRTNQFGFTIAGSSNLVIVVEACTNLSNPAWCPVSTNTLTGGACYFSDPDWTNYRARLYRFRSP